MISFDLIEPYLADTSTNEVRDNRLIRQKLKRIVLRVIQEQLTARQKEVCLLYFYQGMKIPQIAEFLGVNKSTVSRTLNRAIKNLKGYVQYYKLR